MDGPLEQIGEQHSHTTAASAEDGAFQGQNGSLRAYVREHQVSYSAAREWGDNL